MELASCIITVLVLLFACQDLVMHVDYPNERISRIYSSGILRDIGGNNVAVRPRIIDSTFNILQNYGISNSRLRGCRGGRKGIIQDISTSLFTNNDQHVPLGEDNKDDVSVKANSSSLSVHILNAHSVNNKANILQHYIVDNDIDLFLITETWLSKTSNINKVVLGNLVPAGYKILHEPRGKRRGGGVAIVFKECLNLQRQDAAQFSSFDHIEVLIKTGNDCIRAVTIYRPPPTGKGGKPTNIFLDEFNEYIDSISTTSGKLIIGGDFNFHVDDENNHDANKFKALVYSLDMTQYVTQVTHKHGHTLDLVLTRSSDSDLVNDLDVDAPDVISDHAAVYFHMPFRKPAPVRKVVTVRNLRDIDAVAFQNDIQQSDLIVNPSDDITELVQQYNNTLANILDAHAPPQTKTITIKHHSPWFTDEIREARRQRRKAERRWRSTKLIVHREIYKEECVKVNKLCEEASRNYYCLKIEECGSDQHKVFHIANQLINNKKDSTLPTSENPQELSEKFADFFTAKIAKIKETFDVEIPADSNDNANMDNSPPVLSMLAPTSEAELKRIITSGNSKSCSMDPLPTHLLKSNLEILLPTLTKIVNTSLSSASMPQSLKSATVTPLLKKPSLNGEDLKNYRPVSNLPYLSKLIEKIVVKRLNIHMGQHHLHEYYQSAYRMYHSTETALLRVHNDILRAIDKKMCVFLVLLDQSAAFDTVEHSILLGRLEGSVGLSGSALAWCHSYFSERSQSVHIHGVPSVPRPLTSGMPQGSVIGPFGFPTYTAPVGQICRDHGINYHFYADDSQLYLSFKPEDEEEARRRLELCIVDIRKWMKGNHLKLNDSKTEFLVLGSKTQLRKIKNHGIKIGDTIIEASSSARNIGAIFDSNMNMKEHVNALCRACYFHIRNIGKVRHCLTKDAAATLMHAFVSSKLDHMNVLLYGLPKYLIERLQKIQNNGARIVEKKKRREHISPVLKHLHWLPINVRIEFKMLLTVFKSLTGLAPGYLLDLLKPYRPPRALRSLNLSLLRKPLSASATYGDRCFAVGGPELWNHLPRRLRQAVELDDFKRMLKAHLFSRAYDN